MSFKSLYPSQKQAVLSVQSLTLREKDLLNIRVGIVRNCAHADECVPEAPALMHHLGRREQNLEKPIFMSSFCFLNSM